MEGNKAEFLNEISSYTIFELELIQETQRDLYTQEEMNIVSQMLKEKRQAAAEANVLEAEEKAHRINDMLPTEIKCSKCDGVNAFTSDVCKYCGVEFDKRKYYDPEYYDGNEQEYEEKSYGFQYFFSFIIPIVGFVLGAVLLSKDDEDERNNGVACIVLGIISVIINIILGYYIAAYNYS